MQKRDDEELFKERFFKKMSVPSYRQRLVFLRKKYSWILVVGLAKRLKRTIDFVLSLLFLILFSPLMAVIACLIKWIDGGPVFYIEDRVGLFGRMFRFPKFRTMKVGADKEWAALHPESDFPEDVSFKMRNDPRLTKLGPFLRRRSLDELPQLWSVLKGDMSLVGPRPPLRCEVEQYNMQQRRRLDVRPGLTCIWQVSGRSEISFSKQVELDREYIESQSFLGDLRLLLKTIPAILTGRGAY